MATVSIYLNFMGNTEEAFNYYKQVFGTEFVAPIDRMGNVPPQPGQPPLPEDEKNMVMHVALPILGGIQLMATDNLKSMGHELKLGNNMHINLEPDTKEETDRLFNALSDGGSNIMKPEVMFWGDYFGACTDKFGINWMFNCTLPKKEGEA